MINGMDRTYEMYFKTWEGCGVRNSLVCGVHPSANFL